MKYNGQPLKELANPRPGYTHYYDGEDGKPVLVALHEQPIDHAFDDEIHEMLHEMQHNGKYLIVIAQVRSGLLHMNATRREFPDNDIWKVEDFAHAELFDTVVRPDGQPRLKLKSANLPKKKTLQELIEEAKRDDTDASTSEGG